jgi:hypothetical protein
VLKAAAFCLPMEHTCWGWRLPTRLPCHMSQSLLEPWGSYCRPPRQKQLSLETASGTSGSTCLTSPSSCSLASRCHGRQHVQRLGLTSTHWCQAAGRSWSMGWPGRVTSGPVWRIGCLISRASCCRQQGRATTACSVTCRSPPW